ncbi:aminopeptidase N-like isoform X2 [Ooceraea biroi]|uniref:aminopeptidase N-like isoform X2 n=1 Tax=Ooceraea biroi TaxID=2015173 RepID=UPI000F077619|nr:aminopeptidase N-like isoform X2 [Ooceraea biroi]
MQIFEKRLGILFLPVLLSGILITCVQGEDWLTENKTYRELGYRLSKDVLPRHYNISIIVFETMDHLKGDCEIDIEIFKATSNISLHSPDTSGEKIIKLVMKNNETYERIAGEECRNNFGKHSIQENILDLCFKHQLSPGNYTLSISYVIHIGEGIGEGYFNILFQPEARKQYRLLATNIQSIEARKWFPCWDEPEFKATFLIRFNHKMNYKIWPIWSTTRFTSEDHKQDWVWTNVVIPYPISTYHVMFTLTDLDLAYISTHRYTYNSDDEYYDEYEVEYAAEYAAEYEYEDKNISHLTTTESYKINVFSTWSRRSVANFMNFADIVIRKIIESDWFGKIPITVLNINLLALPAMPEDAIGKWRLILYKESLVTYNEILHSNVHKREIARTVARGIVYHEIDNAITLSWWSDLWFKTGLAALLHVEILDEIFPKWRFLDLFVVQVQQDCLRVDTQFTMKPLSYEVRTPSEIKSLFSFPIYVKAPVILRMLQHIMGYEFLHITKNYKDTYKFQSPSLNHLWDLMQNNMNNPNLKNYTLENIMETWTTSNNHPIVYVHRSEYRLSLSVYYVDDKGALAGPASPNCLPITFTTWKQLDFNNTVPYNWILPEESSEVHVPLSDSDGWIIVNLKQTGYYRVRYDYTSLKAITDYLKHKEYEKIHVINRAQIIDDTYYFFMKGEVTYDMFAYLIYYLRQERDYVAWYPMFQIFRDLSRFLLFEESESLKKDMRFILHGLLENLTYNEKVDEDDLTKWLRREAVRWACIFGDTDCEEIAQSRLEKHLNDPTNHKLLPEWREWTYCKGAMIADENVLLKLKEIHINDSKVFDYISCAEKPRFAIASFYYSPSWKDKYPTIFRYAIFVDYAVEHVAAIIRLLEAYNVSAFHKAKLIFIIINRSFPDNLQRISRIKYYYFKYSELNGILDDVIKRRWRQIEYQKDRLVKLKIRDRN